MNKNEINNDEEVLNEEFEKEKKELLEKLIVEPKRKFYSCKMEEKKATFFWGITDILNLYQNEFIVDKNTIFYTKLKNITDKLNYDYRINSLTGYKYYQINVEELTKTMEIEKKFNKVVKNYKKEEKRRKEEKKLLKEKKEKCKKILPEIFSNNSLEISI
jgi:hypothetical protein